MYGATLKTESSTFRQISIPSHAVVANRQFLNYIIAKDFTGATGRTRLYVGKTNVETAFYGFPIPRSAPYKPQLDRLLLAFIEVGKLSV